MNIQFNKQFKNRRKFVKNSKENSQITVTQNHKNVSFLSEHKQFVLKQIPRTYSPT